MKTVSTLRLLFDTAVLALMVVAVILAVGFPVMARYFPLYVTSVGVLLGVCLLVGDVRRLIRQGSVFEETHESQSLSLNAVLEARAKGADEQKAANSVLLKLAWYLGTFFAYLTLIYLVGDQVATAVFLFVFLKVAGKVGWLGTIITVVIVVAALHFAGDVLSTVQLPQPRGQL